MYLEEGRALVHGILLLLFVVIAYWISLSAGLVAILIVGILMILQSITGWCLLDPILKQLNLNKKGT